MAQAPSATAGSSRPRPTPADLEAARDATIPDVLAPGLRVVFAGINPGLYSAATGHHFARPGNRFWPALYRSGFTPRQFRPDEQDQLLALGLGITNVAPRATARAAELVPAELRSGALELQEKVDVIVLAQASMARVVDTLAPADKRVPILASPGIAVDYLATVL